MSKTIALNFDDGIVNIEVNGDPNRVFKFKSRDINQVDKFIGFKIWCEEDLLQILKDMSETSIILDDNGNLDLSKFKNGELTRLGEVISGKVDEIFGEGSAKALFDGMNPMSPTTDGTLLTTVLEQISPMLENIWAETGVKEKSVSKINQMKSQALINKKNQARAKK